METEAMAGLATERARIHAMWSALLRTHRPSSPLKSPESLIPLIAWALDEFFYALASKPSSRPAEKRPGNLTGKACCGENPYDFFFSVGFQAILEGLVRSQASSFALSASERDDTLQIVRRTFLAIADREREAFCGTCRLGFAGAGRPDAPGANDS